MTTTVVQDFEVKYHKNPISGHEWSEIIWVKRWRLSGGKALNTIYRTEKEAQEMTDFLNKFSERV